MLATPFHRTISVVLTASFALGFAAIPSPAAATSASANMTSIINGSPVADGSVVNETSTVTIGTSALLTPGYDTRTLQMNLETGTPYVAGSAVAPEGWQIQYSTNGTTWQTSEPATASTVKAVRATAKAAAGQIDGRSQVYSSESLASIPATNLSATSNGDGWDVFFSDEKIFNIYHHGDNLQLDCFVRASGARCTGTNVAYPAQFNDYVGPGMPSGMVDPVSGRLYAPTSQKSTQRSGVLCVNVSSDTGPVSCGFIPLSDSTVNTSWAYISISAVIGRKIYFVNSSIQQLLCYDAATNAACTNSPMALSDISAVSAGNGGNAARNRLKSDGARLFLKTPTKMHCFSATLTACTGYPVTLATQSVADANSGNTDLPIAIHQTSEGVADGVCFYSLETETPTAKSCLNHQGEFVSTWHSPFNKVGDSNGENWWFDGATTLGRYYWTSIGMTVITCYDFATNAYCSGFTNPSLSSDGLVYAVRVDPQNPRCLWTNSDQRNIRTINAMTGSLGCGGNPVITLQPSQFAPRYACSTNAGISEWTTLKLVSISGGGSAETVTLTVRDALGNAVPGWQDKLVQLGVPLDMTGLDVALSGSRPTFSFAFSGITGTISTASIALDYKGAGPELCIKTTLSAANASDQTGTCPAVTFNGFLEDQGGVVTSSRTLRVASGGSSCVQNLVVQTVPETVTALTGSGLNTTATLRFSPPVNTGGLPLLGFQVSTNGGGNWAEANAIDNGDGTFGAAVTGLTAGTTYAIRVAAYNSMGRGPAASISITAQRLTIDSLVDVTLNTGTVALESQTAEGITITYAVETSTACSVSGSTVSLLTTGLCRLVASNPGRDTPTVVLAAESRGSFTVLANPAVAPGVVETLTVASGNGQLTLTWFPPTTDGGGAITDYQVQYKTGSTWIPFVDGVSTTTGAVITGLTNGTTYDLRVAAVNSAGQGSWTSTKTGTPRTTAGAVTNLQANRTTGSTTATVSFSAPASNGGAAVSDYKIQYKDRAAADWSTFNDGTNTNVSVSVTGLDSAKEYDFRVAAVNAAGDSAWTSTATLQASAAPVALRLSWTAPSFTGGETLLRYDILYRIAGTSTWDTMTGTTSTSETLTGLTNGTAYEVRVAALTNTSTSSYTSLVTATPVAVPSAPQSIAVTPGARQLVLNWTAPADNGGSTITDYVITYKAATSDTWLTLADGVSTLKSATITSLTNGVAYQVRVAAVNDQGTGATTSIATGTPRTTPDAPSTRNATGGDAEILVAWTPPLGNGGAAITGYHVQYKLATDVNWTTHAENLAALTTVITGLADGTRYSVRVAAVNPAGVGAYTSTASAQTALGCSTGALTFSNGARRNGRVDLEDPNRCYQRTASIGVDSRGNALGATFRIPAGAVANRTEITIEVTADAPTLLKGLPSVRVTAFDSVTAQAVNTFNEPVSITLVGDPSAIPAVSTDGGTTWRRLVARSAADVKAMGPTGDGYVVNGSTFTIYTMHLTDFALTEVPVVVNNNSSNSGSSSGASTTIPIVSTTPVVVQGPTQERILTCVSPEWSQTPQTLRFDWQGVTPVVTTPTGSETSTAIQLPPNFEGSVQCQVLAYAHHATGTTQETVKIEQPAAPVAIETRVAPKPTTMKLALKFKPSVSKLTTGQKSRLAALLTVPQTSITIATGATGSAAQKLANARASAIRNVLRSLGYKGQVLFTSKGRTNTALLTAVG